MDVILTHEQADFDAAASVLAAWLLDPQRLAVLPRRLNRNLAAFLDDFAGAFPFKHMNEVPGRRIEHLTLVDTQSYQQNSRIAKSTKVRVIDHHVPHPGQPAGWDCTFDVTGACVTRLVEQLDAANVVPNPTQAGLMLLGIYEDTGFLAYGSATARDARAAARLMEWGANPDWARKYINTPLTEEQQAAADLLLRHCETLHVNGQRIDILTADLRGICDEYSSVAHYLRDMLCPDGLILLLGTKAGVRIIGRATTEFVDVGALMNHYHGGGHTRAASALIPVEKSDDLPARLSAICHELPAVLPQFVTPPVTAAALMSADPCCVGLLDALTDAVRLVERYGFEGYPVVDDDRRLLGLLNSRAVMHARSFGLNCLVEELYDPGEWSVPAEASLEDLRRVFLASGWGQIPVTDEDERVIGIVTRTDLLRGTARPQNLAAALEAALSADGLGLIRVVAQTAEECGCPIYLVGGVVRDILLRRHTMDFDIVVVGDAIRLGDALVRRHGGLLQRHSQFGTAVWTLPESADATPRSLDLISARNEFYTHPTALPTVERSSIKPDLRRRDFSINTLALRLDGPRYGELLDYFGGVSDLRAGLVRVLHPLSFTDDPTRVFRAVRFETRFHFTIEPRTLELLSAALPLLASLTGRRILHELLLFFREPDYGAGFARLESLGVLRAVHPDLRWDEAAAQRLDAVINRLDAEDACLAAWWCELPPETVEKFAQRLLLSKKSAAMLVGVSRLWHEFETLMTLTDGILCETLDGYPADCVTVVFLISANPRLDRYLSEWRALTPFHTSRELIALGIPAGPALGDTLRALRRARVDGTVTDRESESALIKRLSAGS